MLISFKTKLDLNNYQRTLAAKHAGTARHAWNWGLALALEILGRNEWLPSAIDLHKKLVAEVKSVHSWYYEVSKCAPQKALRNLYRAFQDYFKMPSRGKPRFKKKNVLDSFYLEGSIKISGNRIKLPHLGWVKAYEILPSVQPKNVTITKRAGDWYISFRYEIEVKSTPKVRGKIGVDVGISSLATCSDGSVFPNVKAYRQAKRKLAHLQRAVSRCERTSKNRNKAKLKVAKLHRRIADIRKDAIHKLTTWLTKNHGEILVEDLNVSGMLKNHRLASVIADCGFYEFKRQLTYKAERYSSQVTLVDRFYPSSQLCSCCGHRQKMPLSERVFKCQNCQEEVDRDLNASINIERWQPGINYPKTASSAGIACGGSKKPSSSSTRDSAKQEPNVKPVYIQL